MRRLIVNCMVVLMCCFGMIAAAYGVEERLDISTSPQIYRIKPQAPYDPRLLIDAFLVSDDEVAFYILDSEQVGYGFYRTGNDKHPQWHLRIWRNKHRKHSRFADGAVKSGFRCLGGQDHSVYREKC